MTRAIIVEDEPNLREVLMIYLSQHQDIEIVSVTSSVKEAKQVIENEQPDLVFMDINIEGGSSFDVLDQLDTINFKIIFITAFNEFAVKAFRLSAVDFLLKPINNTELKQALDKYREFNISGDQTAIYQNLSSNLSETDYCEKKLIIPCTEGYDFIKIKDIIYLKADANYTHIYLRGNKEYLVTKTLKIFECQLQDHFFFRAHQSFLINVNHIEKYTRTRNPQIIMSNGDVINLARSKKEALLQLLHTHYNGPL